MNHEAAHRWAVRLFVSVPLLVVLWGAASIPFEQGIASNMKRYEASRRIRWAMVVPTKNSHMEVVMSWRANAAQSVSGVTFTGAVSTTTATNFGWATVTTSSATMVMLGNSTMYYPAKKSRRK